jgi:hypothetical protein
MPAPNLLGRHRPTVAHGITIATPGINQHRPLDRLTPTPQKIIQNKTNKNLNNKQGTKKEDQQREWGTLSTLEKGEGARS